MLSCRRGAFLFLKDPEYKSEKFDLKKNKSKDRDRALILYAIQLGVNFLWPFFFFGAGWYLFSFVWLVFLWYLNFFIFLMN